MKQLGIELITDKTTNKINAVTEDEDEKEIQNKFKKLFEENHTLKNMTIDIEIKPGAKLIQQKGRHADSPTRRCIKRDKPVNQIRPSTKSKRNR